MSAAERPRPVLRVDPRRHPPEKRPPREERDVVWLDLAGLLVGMRPIHPDDKSRLLEGFGRLSEETRYQRFLAPMERLTPRQVAYLTEVDHVNHFAWVAGVRDPGGEIEGVGVARFVRDPEDPTTAEFAVVVADDHHGLGIGTLLVHALVLVAEDHGVARLTALCFAENGRMLRILERLGAAISPESPGVVAAEFDLPAPSVLDADSSDALLWASTVAAHPSGR